MAKVKTIGLHTTQVLNVPICFMSIFFYLSLLPIFKISILLCELSILKKIVFNLISHDYRNICNIYCIAINFKIIYNFGGGDGNNYN